MEIQNLAPFLACGKPARTGMMRFRENQDNLTSRPGRKDLPPASRKNSG